MQLLKIRDRPFRRKPLIIVAVPMKLNLLRLNPKLLFEQVLELAFPIIAVHNL